MKISDAYFYQGANDKTTNIVPIAIFVIEILFFEIDKNFHV